MKTTLVAVLALAVVAGSQAAKLPAYFTPRCSRSLESEDELGACTQKLANKGLATLANGDKKFRIPSMKPLLVPRMSLEQGTGQIGLNLTWEPAEIWGLDKSILSNMKMNYKKKTASYDVLIPRFTLSGNYKSNGRVLLLPITGQGPSNFTVENLKVHCTYEWPVQMGADGKEYFHIANVKVEIKGADGMKVKFEGLFNGDPLLGNQMNLFLNENWRDLMREMGPGVAEATGQVVLLVMKGIAEHVPVDEMFSP